MVKNQMRKLSLKKVTVATFERPVMAAIVTDSGLLLATVPTSYATASQVPSCRFHTLK
jgi:hypothetical protein